MSASPTADQSSTVQAAIDGISSIATLPEITVKIIELVEDSSSTAQDLHAVISNDPALCSRVLKVVNSAFYGLPRQIGSINRAIVLLGLNAVKNIAIAASLSKLFRGGDLCKQFSARELWTHSIACGAGAKLLSDHLKLGLPDEAFLAGLFHDIGIMVEMQYDRSNLVKVIDHCQIGEDGVPANDMREAEREIFGADHTAFGAALCESWKFPKSFTYVSTGHHAPLELPRGCRTLACLVYLADRLTASKGLGFRGDLPTLEIDPAVCSELGLSLVELRATAESLPDAYEEVRATFEG